jgi:hypothetical protein
MEEKGLGEVCLANYATHLEGILVAVFLEQRTWIYSIPLATCSPLGQLSALPPPLRYSETVLKWNFLRRFVP